VHAAGRRQDGGRTTAGRRPGEATYDRQVIVPPWLLALGLVLGLLVLFPARRLQLAGLSAQPIALYALAIWLMGFLLAIRPVGARFLIPILLLAYVAPFVAAPERVGRFLRRGQPRDPPRPPIKDVTPRDDPPASR
jgi:hypothetical protein